MQQQALSLSAWSDLHDLALIYTALVHGADPETELAEEEDIAQMLLVYFPEVEAGRVRSVMHDAMLAYMSMSGDQMLNIAVVSLRQTLPKEQRIAVLDDLASIAVADGGVAAAEISFIQQLAQEWDVEQEIKH